MTNKLHFKTAKAANLFSSEITGQLSDGAWENSRPLNHWKFWCNAEVVVDGKTGYEGYPWKKNYNLYSLKKYVKEELLNSIKITKMPWFDMSFSEFTRILTDKFYLKNIPSCLEYKNTDISPKYVKEHSKWSIESKFENAIKAIGSNCSDEFKKMVEDEIVRQIVESNKKVAIEHNKRVDENWKKLAGIGVVDEESLHKMIEKINEIVVTEKELNETLDEVKEMMTTEA